MVNDEKKICGNFLKFSQRGEILGNGNVNFWGFAMKIC